LRSAAAETNVESAQKSRVHFRLITLQFNLRFNLRFGAFVERQRMSQRILLRWHANTGTEFQVKLQVKIQVDTTFYNAII
jgi:hypothetical protein